MSDSSPIYDRETKLPAYAKFGVPEVWIVDLSGRVVEVYREPANAGYVSSARMTEGCLAPLLVPEISVDIAALFR